MARASSGLQENTGKSVRMDKHAWLGYRDAMKSRAALPLLVALVVAVPPAGDPPAAADPASPANVLTDLRAFFGKTARPDGSFRPGIDLDYEGMSDSASSDLAPVAYAVVLHKTFGWKLPDEDKTREFLLDRQRADGSFVNVGGTADPTPPRAGRTTRRWPSWPCTRSGSSPAATRCRSSTPSSRPTTKTCRPT